MVLFSKKGTKQLSFNVKVSRSQQFIIKANNKLFRFKHTTLKFLFENWFFIINIVLVFGFLLLHISWFTTNSDSLVVIAPGLFKLGLYKLSIIQCRNIKFVGIILVLFNLIYIWLSNILQKLTYRRLILALMMFLVIINIVFIKLLINVPC